MPVKAFELAFEDNPDVVLAASRFRAYGFDGMVWRVYHSLDELPAIDQEFIRKGEVGFATAA